MANHTMKQYRELMPYIVQAFVYKDKFSSGSVLIPAVKSWLFMFSMIEELTESECEAIHDMFWNSANTLLKDGKIPQETINSSKAAVKECGQVDITFGGDVMDLAFDLMEGA